MSKKSHSSHEEQPADCLTCKHFRITWDAGFPRGCTVMGFKSRFLPSHEVRSASGLTCLKFEPKTDSLPAKKSGKEESNSPAPAASKRHWVV
ncbi:MAG: uracil-DNA glycosylase [Magnetococcales bacterium]|nr:uracil-DNA glycosylase [Magnetococcales bacterium]MBF0322212.1 uracil-DNA glycosylase [Magnetococcales bacterium]